MIEEDNIDFLKQLVRALETATPKLEEAYIKKSPEDFTRIKKFIIEIQKKISETIK